MPATGAGLQGPRAVEHGQIAPGVQLGAHELKHGWIHVRVEIGERGSASACRERVLHLVLLLLLLLLLVRVPVAMARGQALRCAAATGFVPRFVLRLAPTRAPCRL